MGSGGGERAVEVVERAVEVVERAVEVVERAVEVVERAVEVVERAAEVMAEDARDLWVTLADCIEHVLPVVGFYLAEEEITFLPSPLATMKDIFVAIEVVRVLIIVGPKCSRE
eukprot:CAMPEP_0181243034 /NCGR_PEP_ID=MMETSP1096-20121128/42026_1 /TAXON_ID=156174 ORGANISM="Chrysochromulina ericina, Strain CCMP281" /NCGR_SAMPLE_ID=MMETSP1096 /ASSEMBLY_ACC=CAM_ASM_000453 /LENGTH=112 /DNA_ID=CAMNT_0023339319 /DNA_START=580 /DNA_END=917 /DNA_ORIENTATION=+